jgi:hypothetical protein
MDASSTDVLQPTYIFVMTEEEPGIASMESPAPAAQFFDVPPEANPAEHSSRRSQSVRNYGVPGLLFVLAVVLALVAYFVVLPHRAPLPSPIAVVVNVDSGSAAASSSVAGLVLEILAPHDPWHEESYFTIRAALVLKASAPVTLPAGPWTVDLNFIGGQRSDYFRVTNCSKPGCTADDGDFFLTFTRFRNVEDSDSAPSEFLPSLPSGKLAAATLSLDAPDLMVAGNGESISGNLPKLLWGDYPPPTNPPVVLLYELPDASSYQWSGASLPSNYPEDKVVWNASPYNVGGSQIIAVNANAQSSDATRTFFAGAIVGIAGAALIGGIQELLHVHPQVVAVSLWRRRRRRRA